MSFLIPEILETFLGDARKHNESSGQIAFDCPVCSAERGLSNGDGKGNLEVNYTDGVYKCWVCSGTHGTHGTIGKLIYEHGTKNAMNEYNLIKPDYEYLRMVRDNQVVEKVIVTLPEGYKRLTTCSKFQWKYSEVMTYLKDRGITKEMIDRYDIGFTTEGKYHDRVIIPSYDKEGVLDYYIARGFSKWTRPKYLNPEAEKMGVIFNSRFISLDATIYLVEGVFDHMVIPNSIPMLGKVLSDELLMFLRGARANIVVVLDNDAIEDAKGLYQELNVSVLRNKLRLCELPEGRDPSKMYEVYGAEGIQRLLNKNTIKLLESRL